MPDVDDNEVARRGQAPDVTGLTNKIAELSASLEQTKAVVAERETKIKELEGATGGFKTANGQLTAKLTDLETQLAASKQALETQTGELTNWTTKFDQLNQAHTTLTAAATADQQQLQLFNLIATEPKYHPLIAAVDGLKTDADPAKQKEILDKMATVFQTQSDQRLESYRAGATLPAGKSTDTKPGISLPTDPKVAFAEYQSLLGAVTPEAISRRAELYTVISTAEFGGENGKQQN